MQFLFHFLLAETEDHEPTGSLLSGGQGQAEPDVLSRGAGQVAEPSPQDDGCQGAPRDPPPDALLSPRVCPASPLGHRSASGHVCPPAHPPRAAAGSPEGREWPRQLQADAARASQHGADRPLRPHGARLGVLALPWGQQVLGEAAWGGEGKGKGSRPSGGSAPPEHSPTAHVTGWAVLRGGSGTLSLRTAG